MNQNCDIASYVTYVPRSIPTSGTIWHLELFYGRFQICRFLSIGSTAL